MNWYCDEQTITRVGPICLRAPGGTERADERASPGGPVAAGITADVGNPDVARNDAARASRPAAGRGDRDPLFPSSSRPNHSPLRFHPAAL